MDAQTRRAQALARMVNATGISWDDMAVLRRIEMTLHRWAELECGTDGGCIERDENTGKPYWLNSTTMRRSPVADRERGALRRLASIMARYPHLTSYHQTDPRGCALYVLREQDMVPGHSIDSIYNRGVAVSV